MLDGNHDGYITCDDLQPLLLNLFEVMDMCCLEMPNDEDDAHAASICMAQSMFAQMDSLGKGKVSKAEFRIAFLQHRQEWMQLGKQQQQQVQTDSIVSTPQRGVPCVIGANNFQTIMDIMLGLRISVIYCYCLHVVVVCLARGQQDDETQCACGRLQCPIQIYHTQVKMYCKFICM